MLNQNDTALGSKDQIYDVTNYTSFIVGKWLYQNWTFWNVIHI